MEENDKERITDQLNNISKIIEQENTLFLSMSSLSIAIIVILSLGKELVNFKLIESKILLTIFLFIIIVILITYQYSLDLGKGKSLKIIEQILDKKISSELKNMNIFNKILSYIPKIITTIFFICIIYIIYAIWRYY
jgi:hypothetical protein